MPPAPLPASTTPAAGQPSGLDHAAATNALRRARQRHACGDLSGAYGWAIYAHQLCQNADLGRVPGLRMAVAEVLAPLAARVGDTAHVPPLVSSGQECAVQARAALAADAHALGRCAPALRDLADLHAAAVNSLGADSRTSLIILARLGVLYRRCGWHDLAARCLAHAQTGHARYLPADDDLAAELTAITAEPDHGHTEVCTQRRGVRLR